MRNYVSLVITSMNSSKNFFGTQELIRKTEIELRIRNYSPRTIKSYLYALKDYFAFKKVDLEKPDIENIKDFLLKKRNQKLSPQTINLYLNAIKFFYREIAKSSKKINLKFAKRSKKLPVVLTRREIEEILKNIKNPKHRLLIALSYGAGLRVSEVINLKVKDIDLEELTIHLKQTKGRKERITIFPKRLKPSLQNLIAGKNKDDFIFESERGGRLSTRTAQKIFQKALKTTGIKKDATFHSLRHSFATHLLENGVSIRYVQALLGHQNIRTTQIYTKVTNPKLKNIKSPLD